MFSFEVIENYSKERGEFLATAGIGNVTLINFSFVLTFVLFKYVLLYENVKLKRFCFCFTFFSFFFTLSDETKPETPNDTGTKKKNGVEAGMKDPICITLEYYRLVCQALSQLE